MLSVNTSVNVPTPQDAHILLSIENADFVHLCLPACQSWCMVSVYWCLYAVDLLAAFSFCLISLYELLFSRQGAYCWVRTVAMFSFHLFLFMRRSKQYDGELFCMIFVHFLPKVRPQLFFLRCAVSFCFPCMLARSFPAACLTHWMLHYVRMWTWLLLL